MPGTGGRLPASATLRIIGFDTATDDTVVAATIDGEPVFERVIGPSAAGRPVHSEALLTAVNAAAEACGSWTKVDRIAVGTGPGTFTGIRIGIATANGLSLATGTGLAAVSTLEALSLPMQNGSDLVLAALDARRGEVFAALYGTDGGVVWPDFASSPAELAERLKGLDAPVRVGGPGAVRFRDELTRAGVEIAASEAGIHRLDGRSICDLGALVGRVDRSIPLEPTYLRVPDAQLWLERDGRNGGT